MHGAMFGTSEHHETGASSNALDALEDTQLTRETKSHVLQKPTTATLDLSFHVSVVDWGAVSRGPSDHATMQEACISAYANRVKPVPSRRDITEEQGSRTGCYTPPKFDAAFWLLVKCPSAAQQRCLVQPGSAPDGKADKLVG